MASPLSKTLFCRRCGDGCEDFFFRDAQSGCTRRGRPRFSRKLSTLQATRHMVASNGSQCGTMPETNARDTDMKRFTQLLLAIAAVSLISWYTDEKPKPIPPDDPADVKTLMEILGPVHVKLDASRNIVEIGLDGADLEKDAHVVIAVRRLHHVRALGNAWGRRRGFRAIRDWRNLEIACLGSDVTNDGFISLEGMRKLRKLQAHSIFITDAGIRSIAKLLGVEEPRPGRRETDGRRIEADRDPSGTEESRA